MPEPSGGAPPFPVLYLDNHLLAVDKPAGMLVQADVTGDPDAVSLAKAYLKARFDRPGNVFVGLVHRLDRPVSGVLLLARTSKAAARLSDGFRTRRVEKRYLAVVTGRVGDAVLSDAWTEHTVGLRYSSTGTARVVDAHANNAQSASLRWRLLAADGREALVEVDLLTGRKHQIRAQLAACGLPVVGDLRYGASAPFAEGRGIALHAAALTVPHPTREERVRLIAPPPAHWHGRFEAAIALYLRGAGDASPVAAETRR